MKIAGLDALTGIPMAPAAAQSLVEKRTQWGSVNRSLVVAVTVKLDPSGVGDQTAKAVVESAALYADREGKDIIYRLSEAEIAKARAEKEAAKAAAEKEGQERRAEIARQQLLAQREQNIRTLTSARLGTRLANFISLGPLNFGARLNNLRSARAAALIRGQAVEVSMLVQADSSGTEKVPTRWPGKLEVSVASSKPVGR